MQNTDIYILWAERRIVELQCSSVCVTMKFKGVKYEHEENLCQQ